MYPEALNNNFYIQHTRHMAESYRQLLGESLMEVEASTIFQLYDAPFALVSHGIEKDPVFNFSNRRALEIFKYSWKQFTQLPSRYSAEQLDREQRQLLLDSTLEKPDQLQI